MKEFKFASSSSDGTHTTILHDDGSIVCSCPGYNYRGYCKHTKNVKEMLEQGENANTLNILSVTDTNSPDVVVPSVAEFIKPMLAKALPEEMALEDFCNGNYVMEEKFNGHRMELTVTPDLIVGRSRNGLARALPNHIIEECRLLEPGTYDGELFIPGGVSTDVVDLDLQSGANLILFDKMTSHNVSIMDDTLDNRRVQLIGAAFMLPGHSVRLAEQYDVSREMLEQIWARGGEGAIIKHIKSPYRPGKRTLEWVKLKKEQHAELTIVGFQAGRLGPHSKIVLQDEHGVTISVKSRNDAWRAEFDRDFARFLGKKLVISFQEKTRDGKYWHPMADHFVE